MKERPIIFSGEMVRAILDGRKAQTRRALKNPQPVDIITKPINGEPKWCALTEVNPNHGKIIACRHGQPGDRLWVRETLCQHNNFGLPLALIPQENPIGQWVWSYAADQCEPESVTRRRPAIHMPRWASRLTLEIVKVRVERVQEISEEDALAEGIHEFSLPNGNVYGYDPHGTPGKMVMDSPALAYAAIWDSINAKRGFGWDSNPWVWVIEFRKTQDSRFKIQKMTGSSLSAPGETRDRGCPVAERREIHGNNRAPA